MQSCKQYRTCATILSSSLVDLEYGRQASLFERVLLEEEKGRRKMAVFRFLRSKKDFRTRFLIYP